MFAHSLATQPGVPEERNIIVGCGRERGRGSVCESKIERESEREKVRERVCARKIEK